MRARWLARLLLPVLVGKVACKRRPDFVVTRDGGERIYLRRWWLIRRNDWFNCYLHNMILDDDSVIHDHPYWFLSLALTDGLHEVFVRNPSHPVEACLHESRNIAQGQIVYRSSRFAHKLIIRRVAWTVMITGPRWKDRDWGFWCPRGWRHWREYVSLNQDPSKRHADTSGRGVGCGEE